jgi:hypothetical protein
MNLFNNTASLTAQRKTHVERIIVNACKESAQEYVDGLITQKDLKDVRIVAISQLAAAYAPSEGKGHADKWKDSIREMVFGYVTGLNGEVEETEETEAEEA